MRRIFIDILIHLTLTFILSALVLLKTNNAIYACTFLLSGILIDLDHLVDYFIFFKSRFNLVDFFNCTYLKSKKAYLFLHSWELVFIVLTLAAYFKSQVLWLFFLSLSLHLTIDNVQRKNLFAYFLLYRIYKKFDAVIIFPENKGKFY